MSNTNIHSALIKTLDIENLDDAKKEEIISTTGELIYQNVLLRAFEEMKDEQMDEFEKITKSDPSPDIVFDFFQKNIPNFEKMIEEEATKFIEESKKATQ